MRAILVTAGATRNPIDAMRHISANSSGRTGAWIAEVLCSVGDVTVLGSPEAIMRCTGDIRTQGFTTTQDLMEKMEAWAQRNPTGIIIHAAAVGDYQALDDVRDKKLASGQSLITLTLAPTPKILDAIRSWSDALTIVSFKAAPPRTAKSDIEAIAAAQAARTDSALVFANTIGAIDADVLVWSNGRPQWSSHREEGLNVLVDWVKAQC